jgi:hypothetical protein
VGNDMRQDGFYFLLVPVKRISVLTMEVKMDTKVLVCDQSGIDRKFSGLLLEVINS